jgi:hypothetical protein
MGFKIPARFHLLLLVAVLFLSANAALAGTPVTPPLDFYKLPPSTTPCRVFDSRFDVPAGPFAAGTVSVPVVGALPCGIPADAKAVAFNVTITEATADGHIVVYGGGAEPPTSTLNFQAHKTRANNAIVELAGDGTVTVGVHPAGSGTVHVILDASGYFALSVPVAVDDSYPADTNMTLNIAAPGVLSNDSLNGGAIVSYGATTGAEQTTIGTATPTSAGGTVTLNADGSFTYQPATDFTGNDSFKYTLQGTGGSDTATVNLPVNLTAQTITFTSTAPTDAKVGGPTYMVTATASSGLPVTFSIDASASGVCTIAGATVSFIAVGTCVIDADQAGDSTYAPAPQAQQSFPVAKGDQTITFTSTPPSPAQVGGTYIVTATASSGLTVSFAIDPSSAAVCSLAGSTVTFNTVGTCTINANQAGDADWNAAPQAQQSIPVQKGDQTITFTSTPPASATVGGPTYTVTATATSGLPVAFTIDASSSSVCSLAGSTVTFTANGTCTINANQAGDANWNAAPQAQQSVAVGPGNQTITFTSTAPVNAKVNGPTYTVTATATSGLPVTFTIDASAVSVCSLAGSTVSFIGAGTCVINANQPGDANWNAAPQVQQSFLVGKGDQTITFTSTAPTDAKVGGPTYTVTATATSGLPVTFSIDPSASSICTIAGSTVSFIGVGTCVINANQAGDANWNAAPQAQQTFPVAKGDQTITFTSTAPVGAMVGGPTYTVTATATSGLPVTFTIDASATSVCSIAGSTVSFTGAGTCVINANQAGNGTYNPAPQVQQSFAVAKGNQTITFTSTPPANAIVNGPTYTVTATATSGLAVTFTIDPSAASVCTIAGQTVSFIGGGTCVINANQPGDADWNAAPQVQQSFAVAKKDQTITFTSTPPSPALVAGPTYTVTATATSGLPVTFTIDPSASSVCTIAGQTVSFIGAGTCVINANQAGDTAYNPAPQVQQMFPVVKQNQTITFTSTPPAFAIIGGTYVVSATASSGLTVTFSIDPSSTTVCSIAGSTVTFNAGGTCTINANQAGNSTYNPAPQVQQSVSVNFPPQPIASPKETFDTVGNTGFEFKTTTPIFSPGISVSGKLKDNFTDSDGPNALSIVAIANGDTNNGGKVDVNTEGEFTYTPKAGDTASSDSFVYQITDGAYTINRTVTINLKSRVWYVRNTAAAGGQGRSMDPFNTLAAAGTASLAGDYIFVYGGDQTTTGQAAGIVLKANQKLHGEAVGLTVTAVVNGVTNPTLVAANTANRPKIDNTNVGGNAVGINNVAGVEVRGFSIAANTNAVNVTTTASGTGGATISDNVITGSGQQGIRVAAGGTGGTTVTVQNNTISATGNGIEVRTSSTGAAAITASTNTITSAANGFDARTQAGAGAFSVAFDNSTVTAGGNGIVIDGSAAGTTTVVGFANNAVNGNTAGSGIVVTSATFDATAGGTFQVVSGGSTVVGASGNGVGGAAVTMTSVAGYLRFTDLEAYADAGAAFRASGTTAYTGSAGFQLEFQGGPVATATAIGGPAVDLSFVSMVNLLFDSISSTNSASTGVSLSSTTGTFSAGSGSSINNAGTTDFVIDSTSAAVTYDGTITDDVGQLVSVSNSGGSLKSFTGAITDGDDGDGSGISLTNNSSTIRFSGGVVLSTGANAAFTATGGGTVEVCDENPCNAGATGATINKITTTTGTALNVANATIGANNLEFRSISAGTAASGPTNGIVLNTTGTSGGLKVKGNSGTGTGGTIQRTTGVGVSLNSTSNVSLAFMNINNSGDDGIRGLTVNNLDLNGCNLSTNGNAAAENGLQLGEATGTVGGITGTLTITNTNITASAGNNVHIRNTSGTLALMTVTGGSFNDLNDTTGANSFLFEMGGTAVTTAATISGATFSNNSPQRALEVQAHETAQISSFTVSDSTFNNNGIHASFTQDTSANLTFAMLNNTSMLNANPLHAINVFSSATSTGGTITGTIQGNVIGNAATAGSGSSTGNGIRVVVQGRTAATLLIDGNTIRQTPGARGIDMQFLGTTTTGLGIVSTNNVTLTNNNVQNNASSFPLAAVFLAADNQGSPARVRADIRGNVVPTSGTFDYPTFDGNATQLIFEELSGATSELVDTPPASASATAQLTSTNTGTAYANSGVALIAGPIPTP